VTATPADASDAGLGMIAGSGCGKAAAGGSGVCAATASLVCTGSELLSCVGNESLASADLDLLPCAAAGIDASACAEQPTPAFSEALNCAAKRKSLASTAGGTLPAASCESSACDATGSLAAAVDKSPT